MTLVLPDCWLRYVYVSERVVFKHDNYYCWDCLGGTVLLSSTHCFICDESYWYLGQGEFRVVVLEGAGHISHGGIQGNAMEDILGPACFSINPINSHLAA